MTAQLNVHEPKPPDDPDAPLTFSMEGYAGQPPSSLIPFFWAPGWNSAQALNKFQGEVGGPLRGGDPGVRLLEPAQDAHASYFSDVPAAFAPRQGTWLLIPLYHVFGAEELSVLAPAVAERVPGPYLALSRDDAASLNVGPGDEVQLRVDGTALRLPVKLDPALPRGMAGVPVGVSGLRGLSLVTWSRLVKGERP